MGKLIGNERRKLYKKVSTWVLIGIVVVLNLFVLVVGKIMTDRNNGYRTSWLEGYINDMRHAERVVKDDPENLYNLNQAAMFQYMIDNEIPPSDWRTDVVSEYYNLLTLQMSGAELSQSTDGFDYQNSYNYWSGQQSSSLSITPKTPEALAARIQQLKTLLDGNDWREYLRQQIVYIEQTASDVAEQEKAVELELLNLYLDMGIQPVSQTMSYYLDDEGDEHWKAKQVNIIRTGRLALLRGEAENPYGENTLMNKSQRAAKQLEVDAALERLRTDSAPVETTDFLGMMDQSTMGMSLLSLVLMVTAGGIIASEFTSGTVKLLLITPHRRSKIFWAKTTILLELTLIGTGALFATAFLVSGAMTGFAGIGSWQVLPLFGHTLHLPYLLYVLLKYIILILPVLVYGALALMLSAVTRKGAVAISVSLVLMYGGSMVMTILTQLAMQYGTIPGVKFLVFANTELGNYLPSVGGSIAMPALDGTMTLGFSLAVLAAYLFCFMWVARDSFCRRDIK